jgi:hypothetical protein
MGWSVILTQLLIVGWLVISHATHRRGLVGDPHAPHFCGLVGDPHAILSCRGLVGDPHVFNNIHGLVDDPQDSLALSRFFKTLQVDLFVSVCFVVPYFLVGKPRRGIG